MDNKSGFKYLGALPNSQDLINKVLVFDNCDWKFYKGRNAGVAAEYSDTIPIVYDPKVRTNSNLKHKHYEHFIKHVEDVLSVISNEFGVVSTKQAMLTRLCSGSEIKSHKDVGPITKTTKRIHIPIITNEKCIFTVGDKSMNLKVGEIWLIDNTNMYHSVANNGNNDRVHLIIDVG